MNNSINVNVTAPSPYIAKPTVGDGYMIVARELLPGVEALSTLPTVPPRAAALIAGQAFECALKAFLWSKGKKKEIRTRKYQHNLVALWEMAYEQDLSIQQEPPNWYKILSSAHGQISERGQESIYFFYSRYQEGERNSPAEQTNVVHGGPTPALISMAAELKKLMEMVELAVKG